MAFFVVRGIPMVRKALLIAGFLGLFAGAAVAEPYFATVQSLQGKVLISHGKGFQAALNGAALLPGDKVMVGQKSAAVVAFGNGCQVFITQPKVLILGNEPPCRGGDKVGSAGSAFITPVSAPSGGVPPSAVGLGFFALAAASTVIVQLTHPKSNP